MRTTLDIDEDVLLAVKQQARESQRTAGQVLSQLARQSLTAPAIRGESSRFGFRPLPRSGAVVTTEIINDIREAEGI